MIISAANYERVQNFRVDDVVSALIMRPESLYRTPTKYDYGVVYELSEKQAKQKFRSIEDALAAVKDWCG